MSCGPTPVLGFGTVSAALKRRADGTRGLIRHTASVTCPSCNATFTGRWLEGHDTTAQLCLSCHYIFTATWPGFSIEPETITSRSAADMPEGDSLPGTSLRPQGRG